jgi:hypothetical protein
VTEDDFRVDRGLDDLGSNKNREKGRSGNRSGLVGSDAAVLAAIRRTDLGDQQAAILKDLDPAGKADFAI